MIEVNFSSHSEKLGLRKRSWVLLDVLVPPLEEQGFNCSEKISVGEGYHWIIQLQAKCYCLHNSYLRTTRSKL
jgi:hypothetical protein